MPDGGLLERLLPQRRLGQVSAAVAVLFVVVWLLAGAMSVVAGVRDEPGRALAREVVAILQERGLEGLQSDNPLPRAAGLAATRIVVVDKTGLVIQAWPAELVGAKLELEGETASLRLPPLPGAPGERPRVLLLRPRTLPFPKVTEYRNGELIPTETGRLLFGDRLGEHHVYGRVRGWRVETPDGHEYFVFSATAPWVFLGAADTEWNGRLERGALGLYGLLVVLLALWVARDARRFGLSPSGWALLALVAGPAGWAAYRVRRLSSSLCPHCGAPVHKSFAGCPACGCQLRPRCSGCGSPVQPDWRYCAFCTEPLHA